MGRVDVGRGGASHIDAALGFSTSGIVIELSHFNDFNQPEIWTKGASKANSVQLLLHIQLILLCSS